MKLSLATLLRELATIPPERLLAAADALEADGPRRRARRPAILRLSPEDEAEVERRLRAAGVELED